MYEHVEKGLEPWSWIKASSAGKIKIPHASAIVLLRAKHDNLQPIDNFLFNMPA
jgi:hypothetical protein